MFNAFPFAGHANLYYLYLPLPWPQLPPLPDHGLLSYVWLGLMILGGILTLGSMVYLGFIRSFGQSKEGTLEYYKESWLVCKECGRKYPIRQDIPVMLIDEGDKWVETAMEDLPVPPPEM